MKFLRFSLFKIISLPALLFAAGPDLVPIVDDISIEYNQTVTAADVAEGCAIDTDNRTLLRFSVTSYNQGNSDIYVGDPACPDCNDNPGAICGNDQFMCSAGDGHGHGHMIGFADYRIFDPVSGFEAAKGHKEGFCLRDSACLNSTIPKYNCDDQGISAGCFDIYTTEVGCQYIDITGVEPGNFVLKVSVNDAKLITESDYSNNLNEVPVAIPTPPTPDLELSLEDPKVEYIDGADSITIARRCGLENLPNRILRLDGQISNQGTKFYEKSGSLSNFYNFSIQSDNLELPLNFNLPLACVSDVECITPQTNAFTCNNQGLHQGCSSPIFDNQNCNIIDLSTLKAGEYQLNFSASTEVTELSEQNNRVEKLFELCGILTKPVLLSAKKKLRNGAKLFSLRSNLENKKLKPQRDGLSFKLIGENRDYLDLSILGKSKRGCSKADRWKRDKKRKRWKYLNKSGFIDASCSVPAQGLKSLWATKTGKRTRVGVTFTNDSDSFSSLIKEPLSFWRSSEAAGDCFAKRVLTLKSAKK
ncbi:MAG: lysyl oxidase family protein [Bdellovibrionota bacterium]